MLQGDESTVLVHYLDVRELNTVKARQTMVRQAPNCPLQPQYLAGRPVACEHATQPWSP